MRGESRSCLIEADDGFAYVVKFTNNPHGGRRALVNECIGSILLTELGVATPERAFVSVNDDCVGDIEALPNGIHFGSRYPGHPDTIAVYDFLPDAFLHRVHNRGHFVAALVFDQWVSNVATRQAIFFRQPAIPALSGPPVGSWVAQMIDNGSTFAASDWTFCESAIQGVYGRSAVYPPHLSMDECEPWLHAMLELDSDLLKQAIELPTDWVQDDERPLAELLAQLFERRLRVRAMVERAVRALRARVGG